MGGGEISLQPPQVEVGVERGRKEGQVHIGRHHLQPAGRSGGLAREQASAGQHRMDQGDAAGDIRRDPIARDGVVAVRGLMGEAAGNVGVGLAGRADDPIEAAMLDDDARRGQPPRRKRFEVVLKRVAPAIGDEQIEIPLN